MKQNKFSPQKYVKEKARKLPFHECYITDAYEAKGLTSILISRLQPSGKITFGVYLVDRYCLGVKDCFWNSNLTEVEFEEIKMKISQNGPLQKADPVYLHNMIYGAIDFADEYGFKPPKDFNMAEYILEPDLIDDGIDDIEFGEDGMPLYISGPYDDYNRIENTLQRTAGEGNYKIILMG